jgi:hypothetical protein
MVASRVKLAEHFCAYQQGTLLLRHEQLDFQKIEFQE